MSFCDRAMMLTFGASTALLAFLAPTASARSAELVLIKQQVATETFHFDSTALEGLRPGQPLPASFDAVGGRGLLLVARNSIEDAEHFVFEHPLHAARAASLLLRDGRLTGTIAHLGESRTVLGSTRAGESTLRVEDATKDLPCGQGDVVQPPLTSNGKGGRDSGHDEGSVAGVACDDGSRVDLLVAYTDAAIAQAGGETQLQDSILWAVADSNATYAASGISLVARLVGTTHVSGYVEDSASMANDLYRLRDPADGTLDEVSALRDTLGADLVALIRADGGGACGIAFLVSSSIDQQSYGVSVTALGCFPGKTFTHELGHNMGCCHAPGDGGGCTSGGVFPYSTGHRFFGTNDAQYRTVMAYAPGARIGRFSSPAVIFEGSPTGIADERDNVRSMNESRFIFTNFRCEVCFGDFDSSGEVNASDLASMLSNWGVGSKSADLTGDGNTDAADLAILLGNWGACD